MLQSCDVLLSIINFAWFWGRIRIGIRNDLDCRTRSGFQFHNTEILSINLVRYRDSPREKLPVRFAIETKQLWFCFKKGKPKLPIRWHLEMVSTGTWLSCSNFCWTSRWVAVSGLWDSWRRKKEAFNSLLTAGTYGNVPIPIPSYCTMCVKLQVLCGDQLLCRLCSVADSDPVPFWPLNSGSGMGKKSGSGSGMNNLNHTGYLETIFMGFRNTVFLVVL